MGKIDILTKDYISDDNVFADAFNYFIYGGKPVIDAECLTDLDAAELTVPYGSNGENLPVQRYRDKIKSWTLKKDDCAAYLLLAIENQTELHWAMPVKNMVYDALQYAEQVTKTAQKHRHTKEKASSSAEYLSGFYESDYLIPVFTLVIYFNPERWTGPKTLHEMFNVRDKNILSFLPDYKINLIAPASMTKEELDKMNSDLREVLLFIKYSKDKEKLQKLVKNDDSFSHMNQKAVQVINAITNSKIKTAEVEEEIDMCLAIDEMCQDAREDGIRTGMVRRNREIVENLLKKDMEDTFIMDVACISRDELYEIKKEILENI